MEKFLEDEVQSGIRTFTQKTKNSDVTFIIGDEKIYASKAVLSIASPVFCKMFEKGSVDKITLADVTEEHFVEFLRFIYPERSHELNETTVYWVLPFAHKYNTRNLKMTCVKLLTTMVRERHYKDAMQLYRHIKLSELYDMKDLEQFCVGFASECLLRDMENAQQVHMICQETDMLILKTALRKHELMKEDTDCCSGALDKNTIKGKITKLLQDTKLVRYAMVNLTESEKITNFTRALRLAHAHFRDDKSVKEPVMKMIAKLSRTEMYQQSISLLPQELKLEIEAFLSN